MFFPRALPLALDEGGLLGLRTALNTPVISIQELPNGPATAAIAVHLEEGGERALTVAVRALRTGEVVLFTMDEDLSAEGAVQGAIDAALSFSETMGFLFDDEILETDTPANRRRAMARWREVVGDGDADGAGDRARAAGDDELMLDDAVTPDDAELPAATARPGARRPAPPDPPARVERTVPLTKFRKAAASAPPAEAAPAATAAPGAAKVLVTPHGPALGRLQLVKRRRGGVDAPGPSWLARLLGAF